MLKFADLNITQCTMQGRNQDKMIGGLKPTDSIQSRPILERHVHENIDKYITRSSKRRI